MMEVLSHYAAFDLKRCSLKRLRSLFVLCLLLFSKSLLAQSNNLVVNDSGYFEKRGWNVMVFNNKYGLFGDEKASSIEMIHHEVRTATNIEVRLNPTPEQWDSIPQFISHKVNKADNSIEASLRYPSNDFNYSIIVKAVNGGAVITVNLDKPLPSSLAGIAGFNLEFLPTAYFHTTYLMDEKSNVFPLYPSGPTIVNANGITAKNKMDI